MAKITLKTENFALATLEKVLKEIEPTNFFKNIPMKKVDLTERAKLTQTKFWPMTQVHANTDVTGRGNARHQIKSWLRNESSSTFVPSFNELLSTGNPFTLNENDERMVIAKSYTHFRKSTVLGFAMFTYFMRNNESEISAIELFHNEDYRAIVNEFAPNFEFISSQVGMLRDCMRDCENVKILENLANKSLQYAHNSKTGFRMNAEFFAAWSAYLKETELLAA